MPGYFAATMTYPEVMKLRETCDTALIPVASIESHGWHLPLCSDVMQGNALLERIAPRLKHDLYIMPMLAYGITNHCSQGFPATYSLNDQTLIEVLVETAIGLKNDGFKKLIVFNCHGGNNWCLSVASQQIQRRVGIRAFYEFMYADVDFQSRFPGQVVGHACAFETSVMLYLFPKHVRTDRYPPPVVPRVVGGKDGNVTQGEYSFEHMTGWGWVTRGYGHIGDPSKADLEKGREIVEETVNRLTKEFEFICGMDADRLTCEEREQEVEKPPWD